MKLDPKIAEAARSEVGPGMFETDKQANARARRVLKAASENVPDEVVDAYIRAYWLVPPGHDIALLFADPVRLAGERTRVRAAISAGLDKWAEEE